MAETFNNATGRLTSTNATNVYSAPAINVADRAIVLSCIVTNVTTLPTTFSLFLTDVNNVVLSTLASNASLAANTAVELVYNKVVLKNGQKIRASTSVANSIDYTLSSLEITAA